jgi:hypothetical protein
MELKRFTDLIDATPNTVIIRRSDLLPHAVYEEFLLSMLCGCNWGQAAPRL